MDGTAPDGHPVRSALDWPSRPIVPMRFGHSADRLRFAPPNRRPTRLRASLWFLPAGRLLSAPEDLHDPSLVQVALPYTPFQGCMKTGCLHSSDTGMYALRERSLGGGVRQRDRVRARGEKPVRWTYRRRFFRARRSAVKRPFSRMVFTARPFELMSKNFSP